MNKCLAKFLVNKLCSFVEIPMQIRWFKQTISEKLIASVLYHFLGLKEKEFETYKKHACRGWVHV